MISLGDQLGDIIRNHHAWAGPVVGPLAFGESLAVVGILLPGTAVPIIVGGLVGAGIVDPGPLAFGRRDRRGARATRSPATPAPSWDAASCIVGRSSDTAPQRDYASIPRARAPRK
jgi:hypothetical protein